MPKQSPRAKLLESLATYVVAREVVDALDELINSSSESDSSSDSSDTDDDTEDEIISAALQERYFVPRRAIKKSSENMDICITEWKADRPDLFRKHARMDPDTFDLLVKELSNEPAFHKNSWSAEQIPVERQILIALQRFETFGNGGSVHSIAIWAEIGVGTVDLITRRVLKAVHSNGIKNRHIRWPAEGSAEREAAKEYVDKQCNNPAWRDGWCMVDGTLIPLYCKPHWYGDTFFDRKSNYSMNVQIINTPNLKIIDYATGFTGSRHDTHCFASTRLAKQPQQLLSKEEWCWGDAGYPLEKWLIIPYKKPSSEIKENGEFNYNLSKIRIRCEHTIGYLKGRFQSLRGLRVKIRGPKDVTFANAWIIACLAIHAFCVDHELEIHRDWIKEGVSYERESTRQQNTSGRDSRSRDKGLAQGKAMRESLKKRFLDQSQ